MNLKKSEHASLKKNKNQGRFKELARKKAFQKKENNIYISPRQNNE